MARWIQIGWCSVFVVMLGLSGTASASNQPSLDGGKRYLLMGDSNIYGMFGRRLASRLVKCGHGATRIAKPSSGLSRPQFYDWRRRARELIARYQPERIVVMFGGNDALRIDFKEPTKERIEFEEGVRWDEAYIRRVREFTDIARDDGREVLFLSPTNRRPMNARKNVFRIRDLQAKALDKLDRVHFEDMIPYTTDKHGKPLLATHDRHGRWVLARRTDGIHLTEVGADIIAGRVWDSLRDRGVLDCPKEQPVEVKASH
jgi:hypothetical protein